MDRYFKYFFFWQGGWGLVGAGGCGAGVMIFFFYFESKFEIKITKTKIFFWQEVCVGEGGGG